MAIETDGVGESAFNSKVFPQLSVETQKAYRKTTHTKSPRGHHRLFGINAEEDNPQVIRGDYLQSS